MILSKDLYANCCDDGIHDVQTNQAHGIEIYPGYFTLFTASTCQSKKSSLRTVPWTGVNGRYG